MKVKRSLKKFGSIKITIAVLKKKKLSTILGNDILRTTKIYKDQNNDIGDRILTGTADVTELKENKLVRAEKRINEPSKKGKVIVVNTSPYKKKKGSTVF